MALVFTNTVSIFCIGTGYFFSWFDEFKSFCNFLCPLGCRRDTYKAKVGNYLCLPCPSNSESVPQAIMCKCKRHFYRLPGNNDTDICHGKEVRKSYEESVIVYILA